MDRPLADSAKLLAKWMEWETGETPPGRVLADLKIAGLREFLEELANQSEDPVSSKTAAAVGPTPES